MDTQTKRLGPRAAQPKKRENTAERAGPLLRATALAYIVSSCLDVVPLPGGSPSLYIGLAFVAFWIASLLVTRKRLELPRGGFLILLTLCVWIFLGASWSVAPDATLRGALTFAGLSLTALAIADIFRDNFRAPAIAMTVGATIAAIATYLSGADSERFGRASFLSIDENVLALVLCLGAAAASWLAISTRKQRVRLPSIVALLLIGGAVLLTGSRTGVGSLAAILLAGFLLSVGSIRASIVGLGILIFGYISYLSFRALGLVPERVLEFLDNPIVIDNRSEIIDAYRITQHEWQYKGVGTNADFLYLQQTGYGYNNAHSAFWKTWIELGLVGLVLWIILLAFLIAYGRKAKSPTLLLLALAAALPFWLTLGGLQSNTLWVYFGLALSGGFAARGSHDQPTGRREKYGST